jgi:peptidylprolyl isomerase
VATSRRRERELARRRFERRRQAELERRARSKRRNTIIGAVVGTLVVITVVVIVAVVVVTGGSSKKKAAVKPNATSTASTTPTPTAPPAPKTCAAIKPNPPTKGAPTFPAIKGKLSTKLVIKDLTKGHGRAAKLGDSLKVFYTGVSCDTGKVFDSSYLHNPLAPFPVAPLGTANVIAGWNRGLIGAKAGGLRELIIPASSAYGAAGQQGIEGNDTLVFLVKVTSVKKG